jgi:hypothetical protein
VEFYFQAYFHGALGGAETLYHISLTFPHQVRKILVAGIAKISQLIPISLEVLSSAAPQNFFGLIRKT